MQHTPIRKFSIMKYSIPVAASLLIGLVTFAAYQITSSIHKHDMPPVKSEISADNAIFTFHSPTEFVADDSFIMENPIVFKGALPVNLDPNQWLLTSTNYNYFSSLLEKKAENASIPVKIESGNSDSKNQSNSISNNTSINATATLFPSNNSQPNNSQNNQPYIVSNLANQVHVNQINILDTPKIITTNNIGNQQVHSLNSANETHVVEQENTIISKDSALALDNNVPSYEIKIPNVFTPNNDGVNDFFVIQNIEKCSFNQLFVFNKSGKLIYDKTQYQNNWDAKLLPNDVYFYQFKYVLEGKEYIKNGSVSVLR